MYWSVAECHLQHLECQVCSVARLSRIKFSYVIDVVLQGLVCCTRLLQTLITVCSASFHLFLLESDISELRSQLIHWSLKYQGVSPNLHLDSISQFARCLVPAQVRMWNDLPYTVFDTGTLDGFNGAINHWLLP